MDDVLLVRRSVGYERSVAPSLYQHFDCPAIIVLTELLLLNLLKRK
jgi:hypothetical protein